MKENKSRLPQPPKTPLHDAKYLQFAFRIQVRIWLFFIRRLQIKLSLRVFHIKFHRILTINNSHNNLTNLRMFTSIHHYHITRKQSDILHTISCHLQQNRVRRVIHQISFDIDIMIVLIRRLRWKSSLYTLKQRKRHQPRCWVVNPWLLLQISLIQHLLKKTMNNTLRCNTDHLHTLTKGWNTTVLQIKLSETIKIKSKNRLSTHGWNEEQNKTVRYYSFWNIFQDKRTIVLHKNKRKDPFTRIWAKVKGRKADQDCINQTNT